MYFVHVTHVVLKSHTAYTTEPECSEIDNFDKKKNRCDRPPRHLYSK